MVGQKFRSNTGLERVVLGQAKRSDEAPALVIYERNRGEFVMTVANFKRWIKSRRCELISKQEVENDAMQDMRQTMPRTEIS